MGYQLKKVGFKGMAIPWRTGHEWRLLNMAFQARRPDERSRDPARPDRRELRAAARANRRAEVAERKQRLQQERLDAFLKTAEAAWRGNEECDA